ncbi:DUF4037 domain-containing protein [Microlunatus parietis]|uniref:DUF4037 domain-containing protein n=1 Tax=Microlunatus parietis TaxID=682979 RepID=A0A7Y9IC49_9ACTN|nr:DUF4037 domain-containing protein [Microlunatus parietis]NYE74112.1 hypothetical protein [Microlunatus parietis]
MAEFVKGLELAHSFYEDVVAPLIGRPHTACLIGEGSEVLGYDTERSTDHEWGPRLQVFLAEEDVALVRDRIQGRLPLHYRDRPTSWYSLDAGKETHHLEIGTLTDWLARRIPTITLEPPDLATWLSVPQQHLLQLTAGRVFRDDLGELTALRTRYQWYPDDVWRWIMAAQWHLIANQSPFLGRSVELGDLRGARLITARLCRLIMELAFLQERRYRPYDKWFSRAFDDLDAAGDLGPLIDRALTEPPTGRADDSVLRAMILAGSRHNELGLSEPVPPKIGPFEVGINAAVRPYPVLNSAALIDAIVDSITDPALRDLPRVGTIDQLTHADDLLINFTEWPARLARTFRTQPLI